MFKVADAVKFLEKHTKGLNPEVAMILGSGLGVLAEELAHPVSIPYQNIPGFPSTGVKGHAGQLVFGELEGKQVVIMQGRLHYYEGHPIQTIAFPVRVMQKLGAGQLIVTNAAGAVNSSLHPGDLMLIRDHINFAFTNPLIGHNDDALGPRFPDTSHAYSEKLQTIARKAATSLSIDLKEGVYQFMTGPSYETPTEVRMAKKLGADVIGMSTVPEVIAAVHSRMEVLGISFVSNLGAGIAAHQLSHKEVIDTFEGIKTTFISLVRRILRFM